MTLKEKRLEWEQGGEELLVVTDEDTVYVVLEFDGEFSLHRYFILGGGWNVSIDIENSTLKKCLEEVTEAFNPRIIILPN